MKLKIVAALAMSAACSMAHAQFENRDLNGDGVSDALYDRSHNLTWLSDANYYATLGLPADTSNYGNVGQPLAPGQLRWTTARSWVDSLVLGGFDDWRMPTRLLPAPGSYPNSDWCPPECVRQTPIMSGIQSEMSFLAGALGQFTNIANGSYMTASPGWQWEEMRSLTPAGVAGDPSGITDETGLLSGYLLIVRTGDVGTPVTGNIATPVPEPGTWALMSVGLLAVGAHARRKQRQASSRVNSEAEVPQPSQA